MPLGGIISAVFDVARQVLGSTSHSTVNTGKTLKIHFQRWPGTDSTNSGIEHADATKTVKYTFTIGSIVQMQDQDIGAEGLVTVNLKPGRFGTLQVFGSSYDVSVVDPLEDRTTVRGSQRRLQMLGYELGGVDGAVGPKTDRSTLNFQADNPPLEVDGIIGNQTRNSLKTTIGE